MNVDLDEVRRALEALPDTKAGAPLMTWTADEEALLLKHWPRKRKSDVARALGKSERVCRRRYEELVLGPR